MSYVQFGEWIGQLPRVVSTPEVYIWWRRQGRRVWLLTHSACSPQLRPSDNISPTLFLPNHGMVDNPSTLRLLLLLLLLLAV